MAGGLNRAGDKIGKGATKVGELTKYFEETFTTEIVNQFSGSAKQLETTLKDVDTYGLVKALSGFCDRMDKDTIDNLNDSSKALLKALNNAEEQQTIKELTKTLKTLNSLSDWFSENEKLMKLAKYGLYAGVAYAILSPIIGALQGAQQARSAAAFREQVLEKLNILTANTLQQSRLQAGMVLQLHALLEGRDLGEQQAQFEALSEEAKNVLLHTPTIDASILRELTNRFINTFYIDAGMNLLDGATPVCPSPTALNAVIFNRMPFWPAHDATKLTYALILQNFAADRADINELMKEISALFADNGGDNFYYNKLVYEHGFREKVFAKLIQDLIAYRQGQNDIVLDDYGQRMLGVWQLAEGRIKEIFENPSADIIATIINRALLEYCKDTAIYFRAGYNTKAEVQSGILNGLSNLLHPVETLTSAMQGLGISGTAEEQRATQARMIEHVQGHPTGVTTEVVVSAAPFVATAGFLGWYYGTFTAATAAATAVKAAVVGAGGAAAMVAVAGEEPAMAPRLS